MANIHYPFCIGNLINIRKSTMQKRKTKTKKQKKGGEV